MTWLANFVMEYRGWLLGVLALFVAGGILRILYFAYRPMPIENAVHVEDLSRGSICLVPAFENLGRRIDTTSGRKKLFNPGKANLRLAELIIALGNRCSIVLAQRAVTDGLPDDEIVVVSDGEAPVYKIKLSDTVIHQMHKDVAGTYVDTLHAFDCALDRLGIDRSKKIVLLTHDKQFDRALSDLRARLQNRGWQAEMVTLLEIRGMPYQDDSLLRPLIWAVREQGAMLWDGWRRNGDLTCPQNVVIHEPL